MNSVLIRHSHKLKIPVQPSTRLLVRSIFISREIKIQSCHDLLEEKNLSKINLSIKRNFNQKKCRNNGEIIFKIKEKAKRNDLINIKSDNNNNNSKYLKNFDAKSQTVFFDVSKGEKEDPKYEKMPSLSTDREKSDHTFLKIDHTDNNNNKEIITDIKMKNDEIIKNVIRELISRGCVHDDNFFKKFQIYEEAGYFRNRIEKKNFINPDLNYVCKNGGKPKKMQINIYNGQIMENIQFVAPLNRTHYLNLTIDKLNMSSESVKKNCRNSKPGECNKESPSKEKELIKRKPEQSMKNQWRPIKIQMVKPIQKLEKTSVKKTKQIQVKKSPGIRESLSEIFNKFGLSKRKISSVYYFAAAENGKEKNLSQWYKLGNKYPWNGFNGSLPLLSSYQSNLLTTGKRQFSSFENKSFLSDNPKGPSNSGFEDRNTINLNNDKKLSNVNCPMEELNEIKLKNNHIERKESGQLKKKEKAKIHFPKYRPMAPCKRAELLLAKKKKKKKKKKRDKCKNVKKKDSCKMSQLKYKSEYILEPDFKPDSLIFLAESDDPCRIKYPSPFAVCKPEPKKEKKEKKEKKGANGCSPDKLEKEPKLPKINKTAKCVVGENKKNLKNSGFTFENDYQKVLSDLLNFDKFTKTNKIMNGVKNTHEINTKNNLPVYITTNKNENIKKETIINNEGHELFLSKLRTNDICNSFRTSIAEEHYDKFLSELLIKSNENNEIISSTSKNIEDHYENFLLGLLKRQDQKIEKKIETIPTDNEYQQYLLKILNRENHNLEELLIGSLSEFNDDYHDGRIKILTRLDQKSKIVPALELERKDIEIRAGKKLNHDVYKNNILTKNKLKNHPNTLKEKTELRSDLVKENINNNFTTISNNIKLKDKNVSALFNGTSSVIDEKSVNFILINTKNNMTEKNTPSMIPKKSIFVEKEKKINEPLNLSVILENSDKIINDNFNIVPIKNNNQLSVKNCLSLENNGKNLMIKNKEKIAKKNYEIIANTAVISDWFRFDDKMAIIKEKNIDQDEHDDDLFKDFLSILNGIKNIENLSVNEPAWNTNKNEEFVQHYQEYVEYYQEKNYDQDIPLYDYLDDVLAVNHNEHFKDDENLSVHDLLFRDNKHDGSTSKISKNIKVEKFINGRFEKDGKILNLNQLNAVPECEERESEFINEDPQNNNSVKNIERACITECKGPKRLNFKDLLRRNKTKQKETNKVIQEIKSITSNTGSIGYKC